MPSLSILASAAALLNVAACFTSTTISTSAGTVYFVPHIEVARITGLSTDLVSSPLTPFVVVNTPNATVSPADIVTTIASYAEYDDVYSDYFASLMYLQGNATVAGNISTPHILSTENPSSAPFMPGPYFLASSGSVYKVYRLYSDVQSAFTAGVIEIDSDHTFTEISAASFSSQAEASVPVPSRLYYEKATSCHPLRGKRIAVKDVYHLKGVKTGAGCRSFYELYPKRNASAPAVQRLIDQGAVIVGKSKTSQFANGENPTADWIEVLAPFNPRGDGWQYPSSSSSGSGAAMASYDWLDASIGTDTSGSMRFPAAYNGVYGGRQSHGGLTTDGVVPVSTTLDTLGIFARSAMDHKSFVQAWYGLDTYGRYTKFPTKVYRVINSTMGGFPVTVEDAQTQYDAFIEKLSAFLNATVTDLEPSVEWKKSGPVSDQELLVYTNMTYLAIAWYEQVQLLQKPFFADWAAYVGNPSEQPKIGPKARASFDYGNNNVTDASYQTSLEIKANFTQWWSEKVNPVDAETCSQAIYVYPTGSKGAPTYRDTYLSAPNVVVNWQVSHAAVYAGLPDYAVPIGQVSYTSRVTGVNETLPISISIGAARGCDWMLEELIVQLETAGIVFPVKTGATPF